MGGDTTDPLVAREIRFLERYEIEDNNAIRVQPCISPVWDTAIAMVSLEEAGVDPAHPSLDCGGALAARQSDSWPGRLASEESECRAGRMGFRVSERFLSRCGRHGVCVDGSRPRGRSRSRRGCRARFAAASRGCSACKIAMAAGALSTTRTICNFLNQHSVCRSQCDARSFHGRRDGSRGGMPGANGLAGVASRARARAGIFAEGPNGRWFLVWALGRELRLRHERRAARA